MLDADTSPEAEAALIALLREAPAWRKLRAMGQLNAMAKVLALSGLRERYPQATEPELQRRLADRVLGKELAAEVYGPYSRMEVGEGAPDVV